MLKTTAALATGQIAECRLPGSTVRGGYCSILNIGLLRFVDGPEEKFFEMFIIPFQAPNGDALIVRQGEEIDHAPVGRHGHPQLTLSVVMQYSGPLNHQLP